MSESTVFSKTSRNHFPWSRDLLVKIKESTCTYLFMISGIELVW